METGTALTTAAERWPGGMIASTSQLIEAGIDDRVISACVRAGVLTGSGAEPTHSPCGGGT